MSEQRRHTIPYGRRLKSPYHLSPKQITYIKNVFKFGIEQQKVTLIEAGTGLGKTIANLLATMTEDSGKKIVYLSKTHVQNQQIMKEAKKLFALNNELDQYGTALQMASKRKYCMFDEKDFLNYKQMIGFCKQNRQQWEAKKEQICKVCPEPFGTKECYFGGKCVKNCRAIPLHSPFVVDEKDMIIMSENRSCCAYYSAREILNSVDLFSGSYMYLLSDKISKAIDFETLEDVILVFDEGHNLEDICCELVTVKLDTDSLGKRCNDAFQLYPDASELMDKIKAMVDKIKEIKLTRTNKREEVVSGLEIYRVFGKKFKVTDRILLEAFKRELYRQGERDDDVFEQLDNLKMFITNLTTNHNSFCYRIKNVTRVNTVFEQICLDASVVFKKFSGLTLEREGRIGGAHSIIICSGTLSPLPTTAKLLGLSQHHALALGTMIDSSNQLIIAADFGVRQQQLSTKYHLRTRETFRDYRESIIHLLSTLPKKSGALVFFASHKLMQDINLPDYIHNIRVFKDSKSESVNVNEFKQEIDNGRQAVILSYYSSTVAEGADFPDNYCRMAIMCGFQFPVFNDPVIKQKIEYLNLKEDGLGEMWYKAKGVTTMIQALGRVWRHVVQPNPDFGVGVILESRVKQHPYTGMLPNWAKQRMKLVDDVSDATDNIRSFFKNKLGNDYDNGIS
jgi:Rad3-related DNA helicase